MSNLASRIEQPCDMEENCGAIERLLQPKEKDLGGFSVRRLLPTTAQRMLGPWVFFDHMGPADFAAGDGINVRPHPHIGIATVTYLFEGEIFHRDSLGSEQAIRPGDVNLMVAGRGITHSERERPAVTATAHRLHGLQLWLALPEADEETEPAFHHYPDAVIPAVDVGGVRVRVMMGSEWGATSPIVTFSDTLYAEAHLQENQSFTLPVVEDLGVYVASGALKAKETDIPAHNMAVLHNAPHVEVVAQQETRIALIGGKRLSPRHMEWNFVSSRAERIEQAKQDWRAGNFDKVVGDEEEYIPLPE